jgi:hypothetical protein
MSELPPPQPALIVPSRFRGPPSSGNGGWSAGAIAAYAGSHDPACPHPSTSSGHRDHARPWPVVSVSLTAPPPLDTPMTLAPADPDDEGSGVVASHDGRPVLSARCTDDEVGDVPRVSPDEARAAEASYHGLAGHPFPTCFSCGTGREAGDGLLIFPGRVADHDGRARVAATWTPDPTVGEDYHVYAGDQARAALPVTWAALDCVGGWAGDLEERLMVLARMTARIDSLPLIGEEHVVVGMGRGNDGRKTFTSATIYDADGRVVASAEHLWVAVDPATFA